MDRAKVVKGQASGNKCSIPLVRLDLFLADRFQHGRRCKNYTVYTMLRQLVIQRKSEAVCLIAVYEVNILCGMFFVQQSDIVLALENAQDFYDRIKAEQNRINKAGKSYTVMKTIDTVLWIVGDKKNK